MLPGWLKPFFWDSNFQKLSLPADESFVIERLLTRGSWRAQRWLRRHSGDDAIRTWIIRRRGRPLTERQLAFWQLLLDIPEEPMSDWLEEKKRSPWFGRRREASS